MELEQPADAATSAKSSSAKTEDDSGLDAELFYRLLVGELNARGGDPGTAYSLMLDAARETNDAKLYQRATDIALQARAGDQALKAAQAWRDAYPDSRDANRYVLQILVALNRIEDTTEPLRSAIKLAEPDQRPQLLLAIPRAFGRASDKKLAASVVERALEPWSYDTQIGAESWVAIGRMRLAAGDDPGALQAANRAQKLDQASEGAALLALEMMNERVPSAEAVVKVYLIGNSQPEVRLAYARSLIQAQRYSEAGEQLRVATTQKPEFAPAWLLRGALEAQENDEKSAETSLKRYLELSESEPENPQRDAGRAQAYLALAQIAQQRKDYTAAQQWIDKIPDSEQMMAAQMRRASLLASQGKLDEARKLVQGLPEREPGDARMKLLGEVQLLRDNKHLKEAYDLLAAGAARENNPPELLYDQAMLAEKLGRLDEMETLLRRVIADKPDFHHAYNALGYSFADRNIKLAEARELIQKALSFAPGDPFITDSLGWLEFRSGNLGEAERLMRTAYEARPDSEIAAHYGEVLWARGLRDKAREIWREGLQSNPDSEALR
ncbi:MAG: tetratricopeptide repeat protein, partial [Burkholderiales bacterium]